MDYEAVLRLWGDPYTDALVDRKVAALKLVVTHNAGGYRIADLPSIRDIFTVGFRSLEEHGAPFVGPLCELLSIFGLPYKRGKAREEMNYQGLIVDIIRVVVAVLVWDVPDIQMAAAQALESFVRAEGFEESQHQADTAASWKLHQRLLQEADGLNGLLVALRHHLAMFIEATAATGVMPPSAGEPGSGGLLDGLDGDDVEEGNGSGGDGSDGGVASHANRTSGAGGMGGGQLGRTYAVRSAAIKRSPELINVIGRLLREASAQYENALILARLGAPMLMMTIASHFSPNIREPLLHTAIETIWNLLEHSSTNFGAAAVAGDPACAALSMAELLDKHRTSNTVRQLGTPRDVVALGGLLESCVAHARTQADKEFRNDVLVVLSLIARKPENRPLFASTGVLGMVLSFATAAEMLSGEGLRGPVSVEDPAAAGAGPVEGLIPLDRYVTPSPADVEFKQLTWTLIATLAQGPYADFEVRTPGDEEAGGAGEEGEVTARSSTCLSIIRSSPLISALLMHLDPALAIPLEPDQLMATTGRSMFKIEAAAKTTGSRQGQRPPAGPPVNVGAGAGVHPYLASLPVAARRALEIEALDILTTIAPMFGEDIVAAGGLEILSSYLRVYTDVLNGSAPLPGSDGGAAQPTSPARLSQRQQKVLRETAKQGMDLTGTLPGAPRTAVPFVGKHDPGRQYGALRVLHVLLDIGTRRDSSNHLSSMITAGVPTVVAEQERKADPLAMAEDHGGSDAGSVAGSIVNGGDGSGDVALGIRVASRLGELGLCEDIILVLKALPPGGGETADEDVHAVAPADTLTYSAFGRTWGGVTGGGGLGKVKAVSSGGSHGRGVLNVTEGAMLAEGRSVIRIGALKEEVLSVVAALTRTAADVSALKSASLLHDMMEADAHNIELNSRVLQPMQQLPSPREKLRQTNFLPDEDGAITGLPVGPSAVSTAGGGPGTDLSQGSVDSQHSIGSMDGRIAVGGAWVKGLTLPGLGNSDIVRAAMLANLVSNQDKMRKAGGVPALLRVLIECTKECQNRAGGEWGTSTTQPRVATVAAYALRCAVAGNVRSEARFLAESGIDALFDLVECAPPTLMPVLLTTVADLSRNPISHVCVRSWRSDSTGHSAGLVLLDLWRKEEARLGVVHEARTGAVANMVRPLDGSDAAARQLALFHTAHTHTAAAVKRIKPGGRTNLAGGMPGSTQQLAAGAGSDSNSPRSVEEVEDAGRSDGHPSDTVAFRALRRALKAAKLWQQVESDPPGGPVAQLVATLDLRHKIFACLQAVGFDELDKHLLAEAEAMAQAERAGTAGGKEKEGKKGEDGDEEDEEDEQGLGPVGPNISVYSSITASTAGDSKLDQGAPGQFPDLAVPHRVSLELVKHYPELIRGAAWEDVRTRLADMGQEPTPEDAAVLQAQLAAVEETASRIRALQLIQARREESAVYARERANLASVVQRRANEADAMLFNERTRRKPGVSTGKAFAGLNMEEKKAGWQARTRMLGESYDGYAPRPGQGPPTDDGVPWAQLQELKAAEAAAQGRGGAE